MKPIIFRPALARAAGVKTATLRVWDREGKGPPIRFRVSRTQVAYDLESAEKWLEGLRDRSDRVEVPTPPQPKRGSVPTRPDESGRG